MKVTAVRGVLTSAALALICAFIFAALTLYGVVSVDAARILLLGALAIAVIGTIVSESVWGTGLARGAIVTAIIAGVFGVGLWRLDAWASQRRAANTVQLNTIPDSAISILLNGCRPVGVPVSISPHEVLHLLPLSTLRVRSGPGGFYDIPNDTDKEAEWPSKDKIELANKRNSFGSSFYRCEASNHGQINLVSVAFPINLWFGNQKGGNENATKYNVALSPLDVGAHFVFYVANMCPTIINGVIQDTASVVLPGESGWRKVPLNMAYGSGLEQIFILPPSSVRWIDGEPCE